MYLVDTKVISALAPSNQRPASRLVEWLDRASPYLFLSVITVAEIQSGITRADRIGASTKATRLREWWGAIEYLYARQLLDFDLGCAHIAGRILDEARAHRPGFEDIAIAATARAHELTVLTRNLRHFEPLGVPAIDPFDALPPLPE